MKITKCKNCGAQLDISKAVGGVVECEYCHSRHTVALGENSKTLQFLAAGELALSARKFDDAFEAYKKAAECDKTEPEAYFGMALAEHKVQYIKDLVNNRLQPICYEITDKLFVSNKNYCSALECATPQQYDEYKRKAVEIDYIRERFYKLRNEGLEYDCFICVKVTGDDGRKTKDSDSANDVYYHLKDKGYKPFYSEREVQNATGADYEALILYALYSSTCMLIVCSDEHYLQTPWVKNEYMRFVELINDERKETDSIAIAFFDSPIEQLPNRKGRLQGVCLNKPDAFGKIVDFVDKHVVIDTQASPQIERKTYNNVARAKKTAIKSSIQKRTLEKIQQTAITVSEQSKLDIAVSMLDGGNFAAAISRCNAILETNASCAQAYWIAFLAENKCKTAKDFVSSKGAIENFARLESAIASADDKLKTECYDALFNRAMAEKSLSIYEEYISLPDSDSEKIRTLTQAYFSDLIARAINDEESLTFDSLIKTVADTDTYIDMNLRFADRMFNCACFDSALSYYKAVADVDESNKHALFEIFKIENNLKTTADVTRYLSNEENRRKIEERVFSYGFNLYATERMLFACLHNPSLLPECNTVRIDFVLSFIPTDASGFYRESLQKTVNWLLIEGSYDDAGRYNDMMIATDKCDHEAYFKRLYIKHKTLNPFGFTKDCLYDDPDFSNAIDAYAAISHGIGKNQYIEFADELCKPRSWNTDSLCLNEDGLNVSIYYATSCLRYSSPDNIRKYYYEKDINGGFILLKTEDFARMNYADSDEMKKNSVAEQRNENVKKVLKASSFAIVGVGLIILGIILGIKTALSGNADYSIVFWGVPILYLVAACIFAAFTVFRGTKIKKAVKYGVTFGAAVIALLFLLFVVIVWSKPELFVSNSENSENSSTNSTLSTWTTVLMFIAGVIVFAQFIVGLICIRKRSSFSPNYFCDRDFVYYAYRIISILSTLLIFIACFGIGFGNNIVIQVCSIAMMIASIVGGICYIIRFLDCGYTLDRSLAVIGASLSCASIVLFTVVVLNILGSGGIIA